MIPASEKNPIPVATDLSPRCDRVVDRAILLAEETGSTLAAVHVLPRSVRLQEVLLTLREAQAGLAEILLGSTVDALARRVRMPLLVVKFRPNRPYRSLMLATDFSAASERALEAALGLFSADDPTLFHAFRAPFSGVKQDPFRLRT